jgi:hypothetical protein
VWRPTVAKEQILTGLGVALVLAGLLGLVLAALAYRRRRAQGPEHEGVTENTGPLPVVPPADFDERPTGRHHIGSVIPVAQNYRPPIGQRRIHAITDDTQILKAEDE